MPRPRKDEPGRCCVLARPSKEHGTVFVIRWSVNGGPRRAETIGPDRRQAEQALALKLAEINRGTYQDRPKPVTFHRFASDWFATHKAKLKPSSVDDYRITLECHHRLVRVLLDQRDRFDGDLVFSTGNGRHLNPSNVRGRVLRPAVERANAKLALEDRPLIPADPHRAPAARHLLLAADRSGRGRGNGGRADATRGHDDDAPGLHPRQEAHAPGCRRTTGDLDLGRPEQSFGSQVGHRSGHITHGGEQHSRFCSL
jgi:hypothetical protein